MFKLKCQYNNDDFNEEFLLKYHEIVNSGIKDLLKRFPDKYNGKIEYWFDEKQISKKEFDEELLKPISDKEKEKFIKSYNKKYE